MCRAVEVRTRVRKAVHRSPPTRAASRRSGAAAVRRGRAQVRAGQRIERRGDHQLQVALGQHHVGSTSSSALRPARSGAAAPVKLSSGCAIDGAVRRAAATAHRAAAAVEQPQRDAAFARHVVQRAVRLEDLPGAGNHAAILVGVAVAQHHFLGAAPAFQQRSVACGRPKLAADGRRVAAGLQSIRTAARAAGRGRRAACPLPARRPAVPAGSRSAHRPRPWHRKSRSCGSDSGGHVRFSSAIGAKRGKHLGVARLRGQGIWARRPSSSPRSSSSAAACTRACWRMSSVCRCRP